MEYCQSDLQKYINSTQSKNMQQIKSFWVQILRGCEALRKQNIIHRDLKPQNILIKSNTTIKLADFGLSKQLSSTQNQMMNSCVGTPLYCSPQILQARPYSSKTDIWSLGVIYYRMLMGRLPFKASNQYMLLQNIKNQPLQFDQNISHQDRQIIRRMLTYDEESRINWQDLFDYFHIHHQFWFDSKTEQASNLVKSPRKLRQSTSLQKSNKLIFDNLKAQPQMIKLNIPKIPKSQAKTAVFSNKLRRSNMKACQKINSPKKSNQLANMIDKSGCSNQQYSFVVSKIQINAISQLKNSEETSAP